MLNSIKSILSAERGSLSSKRFCGIIGWITITAVLLICTIKGTQAPEMVNIVIYASTALLGVDSITDIWKDSSINNKSNKEYHE